MPDVSVRTADAEDASPIVALKRTAIAELTAGAYTADQRAAWAPDDDATEEFRAALDADALQVLLAEDGDTVVGYGVLNADEGRIEALFVRPFWTRSGIATRLLGQLETSATIVGCDSLSATAALNAVPFYERAGYESVDDCTRTIDDVELAFVGMEKDLTTADR